MEKNNGYTKVNLPTPLAQKIIELLKNNPDLGFASRDDFVRSAVREKIESIELNKLKEK